MKKVIVLGIFVSCMLPCVIKAAEDDPRGDQAFRDAVLRLGEAGDDHAVRNVNLELGNIITRLTIRRLERQIEAEGRQVPGAVHELVERAVVEPPRPLVPLPAPPVAPALLPPRELAPMLIPDVFPPRSPLPDADEIIPILLLAASPLPEVALLRFAHRAVQAGPLDDASPIGQIRPEPRPISPRGFRSPLSAGDFEGPDSASEDEDEEGEIVGINDDAWDAFEPVVLDAADEVRALPDSPISDGAFTDWEEDLPIEEDDSTDWDAAEVALEAVFAEPGGRVSAVIIARPGEVDMPRIPRTPRPDEVEAGSESDSDSDEGFDRPPPLPARPVRRRFVRRRGIILRRPPLAVQGVGIPAVPRMPVPLLLPAPAANRRPPLLPMLNDVVLQRLDNEVFPAAIDGIEFVVENFLHANPEAITVRNQGMTLFHVVAANGHEGLVRTLCELGGDLDIRDSLGLTPLHHAARNAHEAIVRYLIDIAGVDVLAEDGSGHIPYDVTESDDIKRALLLDMARVAPHGVRVVGQLIQAAERGDKEFVEVLLEAGVDPNAFEKPERSAIFRAGQSAHWGIVKRLLHSGARPVGVTTRGNTLLHMAAKCNDAVAIKALLVSRARKDRENKLGHTALQVAVLQESEEAVQALIDGGVCLGGGCYESGFTAVHLAIIASNKNILKLLLDAGADVNAFAKEGVTPLCMAVAGGDLDIVFLLLKYKAALDDSEQLIKAYQTAMETGHIEIADCLHRIMREGIPSSMTLAESEDGDIKES